MAGDPQLLTDIRLDLRQAALRPVYRPATRERRVATASGSRNLRDLDTVSGRENLAQAILMRLLTPLGELAELAHPDYGSRLHELIGAGNTATTRNLARLFVLDALGREPRIQAIEALAVEPSPGTRDTIAIRLTVQPIGRGPALELGPFALQL